MTAAAGEAMRVIGIGNEYRGDDGVGIVIARRLRSLLSPTIAVLDQSGECGALLEACNDAEFVVLVDAVQSGAPAGTIHRLDTSSNPLPRGYFHQSTHAFGVAEAVELGRTLRRLPRRLILYGVEGESFEMGAGLSAWVSQVVETVAQRIVDEFRERVTPEHEICIKL